MKNKLHPNLDLAKWKSFSKQEQILNIAAELARAKNWLLEGRPSQVINALDRSFELIDLTINVGHRQGLLRELLRLRDVLAQFYIQKNKNIKELTEIFRTLLYFDKFTSQVEI